MNKKAPSNIELAETFSQTLKEFRESTSARFELLETKVFDEIDKLSKLSDTISTESKLPEIENFIRSAKIAGELNRTEMFKMVFASVLQGLLSRDSSPLSRFTNTESGIRQREHEVNKVLSLTDTFMEALEHYFQLEE